MLPCYLPFWTVLLTSKIPKIWRILSVSPETLSFVYDDLLIYSVSSSAFLCSSRIMDYKSSHSLAFLTSPVSLCESTEFHSAQREFHLHVACAISFIMLVRFFKLRCIAFLKQTLLYQIFSALKWCILESIKRKLELKPFKWDGIYGTNEIMLLWPPYI